MTTFGLFSNNVRLNFFIAEKLYMYALQPNIYMITYSGGCSGPTQGVYVYSIKLPITPLFKLPTGLDL